jgi:acyl carrier protein
MGKGKPMSFAVSMHDRKSVEKFVFEQVEATGADPDQISHSVTLEDLGLDSLDVVELSQGVKKQLGIAMHPKDFVDAVTISDAIAVICSRAGIE